MAKIVILQVHYGKKNYLYFDEMMMMLVLYKINMLS